MWANVYEGEEFGIDRAQAEAMGSVRSLEAMQVLYPELRRRGLRVLPGGDYGFPNNPIGRNARDLELFVRLFGYSPAQALRATTQYGGQVMDLPLGATVLDFAYSVHTDVGHRCRGAKVNGRIVPLSFQPVSGDRVEILTGKIAEPRRD